MAISEALSFAFLETHPTDAARVLERVAPQSVAALLSDAPARLAAPVLRVMLPPFVARCLEPLTDELVSGLLRAMGPQAGVAVLHYMPQARRVSLLATMQHGISAVVTDIAQREEVVELLERSDITDLPVVDFSGRLVGVIRQSALVSAVQEEASLDIQTMVGVSKDERALSSAGFAVVKRLPWLQINLLTAFLAAAVVGLFEDTIAKFTALAVLLPVVAGQSGNAGAQALAVTMRGLFLREISLRHWPKVVFKEISVGFINGIAIAATTAIGVYIWSRSITLVLIIVMAMVISMVAAGFAGALVPITLSRLGQDPAQSSSIILTTVTDIVGFFSFLGIATLLSGMLQQTPG